MAYSKSRARISFEINLNNLKKLSRTASYKKSNISYDHQSLIYQSAIFLLCASIEEYIKTFIEDLFYEYKTKAVTLNELPNNARALSILLNQSNIFKQHIFNGDEARTLKSLQVNSSTFDIVFGDKILINQITAKSIIGTRKYPSVKNLKVLYNRLGLKDILQEAHKNGKKDYTSQLKSFLDIREAISHQSPPSLTFSDVIRHYDNIIGIINQFDRITYSHIIKISNTKYWPN